MSVVEIILAILTFIFGSGGIFTTILFYRQAKLIKQYEAEKTKSEVDKSNIDNLSKVVDEWQEALKQCDCDKSYYRELSLKRLQDFNSLNEKLFELQEELNTYKLENQSLKWHKCTVNGCLNRIPPQEF